MLNPLSLQINQTDTILFRTIYKPQRNSQRMIFAEHHLILFQTDHGTGEIMGWEFQSDLSIHQTLYKIIPSAWHSVWGNLFAHVAYQWSWLPYLPNPPTDQQCQIKGRRWLKATNFPVVPIKMSVYHLKNKIETHTWTQTKRATVLMALAALTVVVT
jgi:hypothetical protein